MSDRGTKPFELAKPDQKTVRGPGLFGLVRRWPFTTFFLLAVLSNAAGSAFNIAYNNFLIVDNHLTPDQKDAWFVVLTSYNLVAYPLCAGMMIYLIRPLALCLHDLRAGYPVSPGRLERCRQTILNLPFYQMWINFLGWVPGAFLFPFGICFLGGWDNGWPIWQHFIISFFVSALLTTVQTFFLLEAFLIGAVYPDFFQDARPGDIKETVRIPLSLRLFLFWMATALVPVVALLAVALNFNESQLDHFPVLRPLALAAALVGLLCSGLIAWLVGRNLLTWVEQHARATEEMTLEKYEVRIPDQRPDEFGLLTDSFNEMAAKLQSAKYAHETFGQCVDPEVRDAILYTYPGLTSEVQEVTVVFIDIRGFTRRSAGQPPELVVELLNRFFTLSMAAVKGHGGVVNKLLGDGLLALFNAPLRQDDHADRAVEASLDLLERLAEFNRELAEVGQAPLAIGVGIHTGPAVVGCIGASVTQPDGRKNTRKEFTAIGETINQGQRIEQLTKDLAGPVLMSEQTVRRLRRKRTLTCLGPKELPGFPQPVVLYRAGQDADLGANGKVEPRSSVVQQ
jgi:adenylate cyclase